MQLQKQQHEANHAVCNFQDLYKPLHDIMIPSNSYFKFIFCLKSSFTFKTIKQDQHVRF